MASNKKPEFRRIPTFGEKLLERTREIAAKHDYPPGDLTIADVDNLISDAVTLGEIVGWANPDLFPPRNMRTSKSLRALGYDVKVSI